MSFNERVLEVRTMRPGPRDGAAYHGGWVRRVLLRPELCRRTPKARRSEKDPFGWRGLRSSRRRIADERRKTTPKTASTTVIKASSPIKADHMLL
jgi:hypothetical protein